MNRRSKIIVLITLIMVCTLLVAGLIAKSDVNPSKLKGDTSTSNVSFKDYGSLSSTYPKGISNDYSYSTLFYTSKSKIYANKSNTSTATMSAIYIGKTKAGASTPTPEFKLTGPGDFGEVIVTNAGVDKDGNVLDAVMRVSYVGIAGDPAVESSVVFKLDAIPINKGSQNSPMVGQTEGTSWEYKVLEDNTPLFFQLQAVNGRVNVNLKYYIHNDNNFSVKADSEAYTVNDRKVKRATVNDSAALATNINKVNAFYFDIDSSMTSNIDGSNQYLDHEFVQFNGINSKTVYYNKLGCQSPINTREGGVGHVCYDAYDNTQMLIIKNTDYSNPDFELGDINGVFYPTSAFALVDGTSGQYDFNYGGRNARLWFAYYSPINYAPSNPQKTVSKNEVKTNEEFVYEVKQYIPNQFYNSQVTGGASIYDLPVSTILKLEISDSIDSRLTINKDGIKVLDSDGNTLSGLVTVQDQANKVNLSMTLDRSNYYNNYIILRIPVKYTEEVTEDVTIDNKGTSKLCLVSESNCIGVDTNIVRVTIKPIKLTYDCKTNGGTETDYTIIKKAGTDVDLTRTCTKPGYKFLGWGSKSTDETPMTTFTMPNKDTTIYGLYEPVKLTYDCKTNGGNEADYTKEMQIGADVDLTRTCTKSEYKFVGWTENPTDTTPMNTFTMPSKDTTIYGIYVHNCDLVLKSSVYSIDYKEYTVVVPSEHTVEEIKKNVTSYGTITVDKDQIVVACDGKTQVYKIIRYVPPKTGQNPIKYVAIIAGIIIIIAGLIFIKKKMDK